MLAVRNQKERQDRGAHLRKDVVYITHDPLAVGRLTFGSGIREWRAKVHVSLQPEQPVRV